MATSTKLSLYEYDSRGDLEAIRRYIGSRYHRLLDYSAYHCSLAGMADEAGDVLNEVMVSLFEKDPEKLKRLYLSRKAGYTELDFFVLQMVKLNAHSPTSPYQHRYKRTLIDENANLRKLKVVDEEDEEPDKAGITLKHMRLVRYVFNGLNLNELEREIFDYKFFRNEPFSQWPGPEKRRVLDKIYYQIAGVIHEILYWQGLTKIKPTKVLTERQLALIQQFRKTRRITIKHTEYSQQN